MSIRVKNSMRYKNKKILSTNVLRILWYSLKTMVLGVETRDPLYLYGYTDKPL